MSYSRHPLWTSEEVEILTGGRSSCMWRADDLTIRADDVRPGDLFFASSGDNLADVFERGAVAAVVSQIMRVPDELAQRFPIIKVPCAYEALRILARAGRQRTHSVVIAVQGFEQRAAFSRALGAVADYYEGGRHLSSSMAAMPEICDFSIFSLSPSLSPDIAIIDRPSSLRCDGLFENMPANGVVLLNMDDAAALDVLAMARACGLSNILTYGMHEQSDVCIVNRITANEAVQLSCRIFDKEITVQIPTKGAGHVPSMNMLLAAMAVADLSDMKRKDYAWAMAKVYVPTLSKQHASPVIEPMHAVHSAKVSLFKPQSFVDEAIFRVKNMVDTGGPRRTVVLDQATPQATEMDFTLPTRLGAADVVCASKRVSVFKNARKAIEGLIKGCKLHHIVPEVLTPGDYVVFKSSPEAGKTVFSESLRLHN